MTQFTLVQMVQKVGRRLALGNFTTAIGSSDLQIQQLVEMFNEEVYETGTMYRWQALTSEATFTTAAQEDQGLFVGSGGILTDDDQFSYIISDTMWDRTARQPIPGPESTVDWQTRKAVQYTSGPFPNYRIRSNRLLFSPIPAVDHTVAFEYANRKFTYDPGEDEYGPVFTDNASVPTLDSELVMQGVRWRWKMAKGLPYESERDIHLLQVLNASSRETGRKKLNLGGGNTVLAGNRRSGDLTTTQL